MRARVRVDRGTRDCPGRDCRRRMERARAAVSGAAARAFGRSGRPRPPPRRRRLSRPTCGSTGSVLDVPFVGLPRRPWQWVFDVGATWGRAHQLSFVASAADGMPEQTNEALIESALAILREVTPKAREATLRHGLVVRERRATFSVAPNAPPRPANQTGVPGLFLAGDWIGTSLPATIESAAASGHAAARGGRPIPEPVNSIVVHYQEIALKGKNRPWFLGRLVRNLRHAVSDLDVTAVRALMGRIEIVLGPTRAARGRVRAHPARRSASPTSRWPGASPLDLDAIAAGDPARPRRPLVPQLPRVGAARRQALSDDRRRRSSARSADASRRRSGWKVDLDDPELTIRVELLTDRGVLLLRQGARARAGCRRAPPDAWRACSRAASIRRWRRTG